MTYVLRIRPLDSRCENFFPQSYQKRWGTELQTEIITYSQFCKSWGEEIEFRTFQIIEHFAQKKQKIDLLSLKTDSGQYNWLKRVEIRPTRLPKVISSEKSNFGLSNYWT